MKKVLSGVLIGLIVFALAVTVVDALTPHGDVWPVMGAGIWVFVRTPGFAAVVAVLAGALAQLSPTIIDRAY